MAPSDGPWAERFPELFKDSRVDYADCELAFTTQPVEAALVSRLHLVAATSRGQLIVCRSVQGWRFLPGGTRELGESLEQLASRELLEEAGARVSGTLHPFASHVADSLRDHPYRPHLPHPRSYWSYATVRAELSGLPTNPPGGEHVVDVLTLPPREAADYLEVHDPLHADVVRLALAMGLI